MSDREMLNTILEPGEIIQWSGISQPYDLFDENFKQSTIASLCWALGWAIFLLGGYFALTRLNDIEIQSGVMICLAIVPIFIIYTPVSDRSRIRKLLYAVTDKRAIVVAKGNDKPLTMRIADIDAIRSDTAGNGKYHIRVGSPIVKVSAKKLPGLAYRGEYSDQDGNKVYKGLVFFNVGADDERAIHKLLKPAAAPAKE